MPDVKVKYSDEDLQEFKEIIDKKDRSQAGVSVPAHALFLTNIEYFEKIM